MCYVSLVILMNGMLLAKACHVFHLGLEPPAHAPCVFVVDAQLARLRFGAYAYSHQLPEMIFLISAAAKAASNQEMKRRWSNLDLPRYHYAPCF